MKMIPSSVYHLQFGEHFKLKDAIKLLPYLAKLGIEGVYCSPYFAAASLHGYDTIDPHRFNPLIGTPKEFDRFFKLLKKLGLYHIADVVPNHMGIKGKISGGKMSWKKGNHPSTPPFLTSTGPKTKLICRS